VPQGKEHLDGAIFTFMANGKFSTIALLDDLVLFQDFGLLGRL
jgi:hypothetical protein